MLGAVESDCCGPTAVFASSQINHILTVDLQIQSQNPLCPADVNYQLNLPPSEMTRYMLQVV